MGVSPSLVSFPKSLFSTKTGSGHIVVCKPATYLCVYRERSSSHQLQVIGKHQGMFRYLRYGILCRANNLCTFLCSHFCLPLSVGGWFWGRGQRTRLNEFPAKCPRSQGRAPRQRMAKQSMQPLASSTPTRANLWKPRKLQVSPHSYPVLHTVELYMTSHEWAVSRVGRLWQKSSRLF